MEKFSEKFDLILTTLGILETRADAQGEGLTVAQIVQRNKDIDERNAKKRLYTIVGSILFLVLIGYFVGSYNN